MSHRYMSLPQPSLQRRHTRFGRCLPTSYQSLRELPPLHPRFKSPTVTPRFPHPSLQRRHAPLGGASSLLPKFWRAPNSATTIQRSHGNTSLPQTSLQKRHLPLCGASPLHTHRIASVSTFPTTIQKVPRFLSLLFSGDTRVFGRCVPTSTQKLREVPLLQPQFKSPTVSPRFLCLPHSRDTRFWAVRPNFNQKNGRVSTFPTTIQRSHRNTSLPQPSLQRRHTPLGGAPPLHLKKVCESCHLSTHDSKVLPQHLAFLILLCSGDTRLWAVRLHCFQNFGEFPTLQPRFKGLSNTSLPQTSLQKRHTRFGRCAPTSPKKFARVSTSPPTIQRSHRVHLSLPTAETRAFRAVRHRSLTEKVCKSFHLSTHGSKVPP